MKLVDCHAHLFDEQFSNVEQIIANAKANGVQAIITAGDSLSSSKICVEHAEKFDEVFAAVGVHPENVGDLATESGTNFERAVENAMHKLKDMAKSKKVVAIGEIGLDYHWKNDENLKEKQKFLFEKQIVLANELNLPVVVHCRDAMGDAIDILKRCRPVKRSLMHCYGGSLESAQILMGLNFSFSFGGVVTFKNSKTVKDVVKSLPENCLLLETDCPYLSPEPFRGQRNEPKNVVYVADEIARLKGVSIEQVAEQTTRNAIELFGLDI